MRIEGKAKAPDYAFRIGGVRKFQLEAKKPSVNIASDRSAALQIRRYAWSASLDLCVLTNFEHLAIYDAAIRPKKSDTPRKARPKFYHYTEFEECWSEICGLLSPDGIQKGTFGKFAAGVNARRGSQGIDNQFLDEIEEWRRLLAVDIATRNRALDARSLNLAVQLIIDRLVFLRIAEDRGIEKYGNLRGAASGRGIYKKIVELFKAADRRYNSGLFHLISSGKNDTDVDILTPNIIVPDDTLSGIISGLYYPDSPYEFSEMPADVLGQVYERFLGKVISLKGRVASIDFKPEVKKAGGVYYTPTYVVQYLINATVGADLEASKLDDISGAGKKEANPYRVVDPACGSGSFLIEVYQTLLDWYLKKYTSAIATYSKGKNATIYKSDDRYRLRISERKRILLDHIYGVDIDPQAVEVTKLSLLLKVLEGESSDEIARQMDLFRERVLPDLGDNIKCGNSLIGNDYAKLYPADMLDPEISIPLNTFDWEKGFPEVFEAGGFDAVVGNPPYFSIDKTWGAGDNKISALRSLYPKIHTDKTDIYYYFLAKAVQISQGSVAFIVSRAFIEAVKAEKTRGFISSNTSIVEIFDFQNFPVFDGVGITTAMVVLSKAVRPKNTRVVKVGMSIDPADRRPDYLSSSKDLARFTLPRKALAASPWRLDNPLVAPMYRKIDAAGQPLSRICKLGQGMQTGANAVFGGHSASDAAKIGAPSRFWRRRARNTDILQFHIKKRDEFLLYLEDAKSFNSLPDGVKKYLTKRRKKLQDRAAFIRGDCEWWQYSWPLQRSLYKGPRIVCPYLSENNRFAIDDDFGFLGLTDTTVIFPSGNKESLKYICALLNSRLLNFRFKGIGKLKSGGIREYFDNSVGLLPIRRINWKNKDDVADHDRIVALYEKLASYHAKRSKPLAATVARDLRAAIKKHETELNKLVCKLYGVTMKELAEGERSVA